MVAFHCRFSFSARGCNRAERSRALEKGSGERGREATRPRRVHLHRVLPFFPPLHPSGGFFRCSVIHHRTRDNAARGNVFTCEPREKPLESQPPRERIAWATRTRLDDKPSASVLFAKKWRIWGEGSGEVGKFVSLWILWSL